MGNLFEFGISWWWLIVPFYLFPIMFDFWIFSVVAEHYHSNRYVVLDIKVPRELEKSPKLMENVVEGMWTVLGEIRNFMEIVCWGDWQDYFSLEIAGTEGKVHFAIWLRDERIDFFKSHIYAQFPEAEIEEMEEDYMNAVPDDAPNDEWEAWGLVWILDKPDAYPIRVYSMFQDFVTGSMVDPLGSYMEVLGNLGPGEHMWYQLLVYPVTNDKWFPDFSREMEKILDRGRYKEKVSFWDGLIKDLLALPMQTISAMFKYPEPGSLTLTEAEKEEDKIPFLRLSPSEQSTYKIMEDTFSKRGFRAQYRSIYVARREAFRGSNISSMMGAVNQFNAVDLNSLNLYRPYFTSCTYMFAESRVRYRKKRLLRIMKNRMFSGASYIFNTEEIASLWHFPDMAIKAPKTPRIGSKQATPPANLPE